MLQGQTNRLADGRAVFTNLYHTAATNITLFSRELVGRPRLWLP
jgi:hypothetical protein